MNFYKLEDGKLNILFGLVKVGGVYKNAAFLTQEEAASLNAYPKIDNKPEVREGFRSKIDGYDLVDGKWVTRWAYEPLSVDELTRLYDDAMEEHLEAEKNARGYTKREPSDYSKSLVSRFRHDAEDWIRHRDEVMLYGLEVQNKATRGEKVPTLDEFKKKLPNIIWTLE